MRKLGSKFNKTFSTIMLENSGADAILSKSSVVATAPTGGNQKQGSSGGSTLDWLKNNAVPLIMGLGGISLLFGGGLFGIGGGKDGFLGGFWGKLLGGGALTLGIGSLLSGKSPIDNIKRGFSHMSNGNIMNGLLAFVGLDKGADEAINNTSNNVNNMNGQLGALNDAAYRVTKNKVTFNQLYEYLKKSGYEPTDELFYIYGTDSDYAVVRAHTVFDQETNELNGHKDFVAVMFRDSDGHGGIKMAIPKDLGTIMSNDYKTLFQDTFTELKLEKGLNALSLIEKPTSIENWYGGFSTLMKALQSITTDNRGTNYISMLFHDGFKQIVNSVGIPKVDISETIEENIQRLLKKMAIICEEGEDGLEGDFRDLYNDPELKYLKEDPQLNKFDEDITLLEDEINNEIQGTYINLLLNKDKNGKPILQNTDTCIIFGKLANMTYYYCRDRENGYLTQDITKSVSFPTKDIDKLPKSIEVLADPEGAKKYDDFKKEMEEKGKELKELEQSPEENKDKIAELNKKLTDASKKAKDLEAEATKKVTKDLSGSTAKDRFMKFLIAVKLPQLMKIKKPGIQVNVFETNMELFKKMQEFLSKNNIDITK